MNRIVSTALCCASNLAEVKDRSNYFSHSLFQNTSCSLFLWQRRSLWHLLWIDGVPLHRIVSTTLGVGQKSWNSPQYDQLHPRRLDVSKHMMQLIPLTQNEFEIPYWNRRSLITSNCLNEPGCLTEAMKFTAIQTAKSTSTRSFKTHDAACSFDRDGVYDTFFEETSHCIKLSRRPWVYERRWWKMVSADFHVSLNISEHV
jgi:hypothetical protein